MENTPVRYHVLHETATTMAARFRCRSSNCTSRHGFSPGSRSKSSKSIVDAQAQLAARWPGCLWQPGDLDRLPCTTRQPAHQFGDDCFGDAASPGALETSMPWEKVRDRLAYDASVPTPEDLNAAFPV
jgi:hypothetical protein